MNYKFETNIEKRMPQTGQVYYVDRMTSDYAIAHPFNVDEFIEQVYQKYEQMAQEDEHFAHIIYDRESLRRMWNKVMQMPVRGDASLYPNNNGRTEPALMEVWLKAGDYWSRGFRTGDLLPAIVPATKITRLDNGEWIALFPKDAVLLDAASEECRVKAANKREESGARTDSSEREQARYDNIKSEESDNIEPANNQCSTTPSPQNDAPTECQQPKANGQKPVELDLFAQMQMQIDQLRQENDRLCNMIQTEQAAACTPPPSPEMWRAVDVEPARPRRQRKPRKPRYEASAESVAMAISQPEQMINTEDILKWLGLTIGAVVLMIVIFKTGLLIPLGLIGLGLGGILK